MKQLEMQTGEIDRMKEQLQAQVEEVESIKTQTNMNNTQMETLWRDRTVGQVAFSASLTFSSVVNLGPLDAETTLVFKYVISNFGNAYNSNTGVFTAPLRGAYHFEFYIGAQGHPNGTGVVLVKNGRRVVCAYEHQTNAFGKSESNGVTLFLDAGDVVYLRLLQNSRIYDSGAHHSTFSGHLLFPM